MAGAGKVLEEGPFLWAGVDWARGFVCCRGRNESENGLPNRAPNINDLGHRVVYEALVQELNDSRIRLISER